MSARLMPIIGVIVALWVHAAAATCAWVLWRQDTFEGKGKAPETEWRVDSAYPGERYDDCHVQAKILAERFAKWISFGHEPFYAIHHSDGEQELVLSPYGKGGQHKVVYVCLPDTVNPRTATR